MGFTTAIGSHSISKEVVGFYSLWFPLGKYLCLLSLVIIVVHVILSFKILRSYSLNDKNLTLDPHLQNQATAIGEEVPISKLMKLQKHDCNTPGFDPGCIKRYMMYIL